VPAAAVVDCATDARVYTTSLRVIRTQIALHLVSVRVRVFALICVVLLEYL
jgi:hypothetical protein